MKNTNKEMGSNFMHFCVYFLLLSVFDKLYRLTYVE